MSETLSRVTPGKFHDSINCINWSVREINYAGSDPRSNSEALYIFGTDFCPSEYDKLNGTYDPIEALKPVNRMPTWSFVLYCLGPNDTIVNGMTHGRVPPGNSKCDWTNNAACRNIYTNMPQYVWSAADWDISKVPTSKEKKLKRGFKPSKCRKQSGGENTGRGGGDADDDRAESNKGSGKKSKEVKKAKNKTGKGDKDGEDEDGADKAGDKDGSDIDEGGNASKKKKKGSAVY